MKKDELDFLGLKKHLEGKQDPQVQKEIDFLIQSQVEFKELKKERLKLLKRINYLESENEKLKNKVFNLGLINNIDKKEKDKKITNLNHLSRLVRMMKVEDQFLTKTQLVKMCCFRTSNARACLDFLERHKLIETKGFAGGKLYKWK